MEDYNHPDFVVYCVETYKVKKGIDGKQAYDLLEKVGALDYVDECYDALHVTNDEDIVWQIDEFMKAERK